MGLFGRGFSAQNALDFALGGYAGLDRRREMDARQELYAPDPVAPPAPAPAPAPEPAFDPAAYGSAGEAAKAGYRPEPPRMTAGQPQAPAMPGAPGAPQLDWQKAMRAAAAGVDITPYLKMHQTQRPEYQGYNRDGGIQVFNPQTGKTEWIADPETPEAKAKLRLLEAQADSYRALGEQRDGKATGPQVIEAKDGLYEYDPTTRTTRKLSSWAAFSPPRAGGGSRKPVKQSPWSMSWK